MIKTRDKYIEVAKEETVTHFLKNFMLPFVKFPQSIDELHAFIKTLEVLEYSTVRKMT